MVWNEFKLILELDEKANFGRKITIRHKARSIRYKYLLFLRLGSYAVKQKKLHWRMLKPLIVLVYSMYSRQVGCEINLRTRIGAGLYLPHPNGIIIHPNVVIGNNCTVMQQVTIGNNIKKSRTDVAVIGNDCLIGAGAKLLGPILIGDRVEIGANAVVTKDISSGHIAAGVPAKVIGLVRP